MDRVFLDANVLFSAAYAEDSSFRRLWELHGIGLCTSRYVAEEALRNLAQKHPGKVETLRGLLLRLQVIDEETALDTDPLLAEKDRPVLAAAIEAGATHLLTGDKAHFGRYYGRVVGGVRILPPVEYLRSHE